MHAGNVAVETRDGGIEMKTLFTTLALAFAASSALAAATQPAAATPTTKSAQQQKMATCNKQATGKKGDERKAFMRACLTKKG
jgi:hypothetical protein